jgi:hypothetical protein
MKTAFNNLRDNANHTLDATSNGDKKVVKIYAQEALIAKKIIVKKSIRFFAINNYQQYLTSETD